jgi:hypothetical protein
MGFYVPVVVKIPEKLVRVEGLELVSNENILALLFYNNFRNTLT